MGNDLTTMRNERATLVERCEALVKTADAANEGKGRAFSDAEQQEFNEMRSQIESLGNRIDAKEFVGDFTKSRGRKTQPQPITDHGGESSIPRDGWRGSAPDGERYLDAEGNEVRFLTPKDRLTDIYRPTAVRSLTNTRNSVGRIIRASITGNAKHAEREFAEMRAMGGQNNFQGGYLVSSELAAGVIDLAREKSIFLGRLGMRTVPMHSDHLVMARVASEPSLTVKAESAAFPAVSYGLDALNFNARTFGCVIPASRELAEDAPDFEREISTLLARTIATSIDSNLLNSTGLQNQLTGIRVLGGTQTISSIASPTWDDLIDAQVKVLEARFVPNGYIIAPRDFGTLGKLKSSGGGEYMGSPEVLLSMERVVSDLLPITEGAGANESSAFVGDFSTLLLAMRTDLRIEITTEGGDNAFGRHNLEVKAVIRLDINCSRSDSICWLSGITT